MTTRAERILIAVDNCVNTVKVTASDQVAERCARAARDLADTYALLAQHAPDHLAAETGPMAGDNAR